MNRKSVQRFLQTRSLIVASPLLLLGGCAVDIKEYQGGSPQLLLEDYFNGELVARGMVQDYRKRLTRHFCVEINGEWQQSADGLHGTLVEDFFFDDGEQSQRIWHIRKLNNSEQGYDYLGTAADVVGEASGQVQGNALQWQYSLQIPIKDDNGEVDEYEFFVDDWMYLINEYHLFNRSELIKFGITLGEITLFFDKSANRTPCQIPS